MRRETIRCLKETAAKCRLNVVRMLRASGHGHIGGTYSSIDMVTALYFYKMNVNPEKPDWEDRDRFLLSAGHKSMVQYAVLAEKGYFPKEILDTYGHLHSKLAGHPNMHKLPGVRQVLVRWGMAFLLRQEWQWDYSWIRSHLRYTPF